MVALVGRTRSGAEALEVVAKLRENNNVVAPPWLGAPVPAGFTIVWSPVPVDPREAKDGGDFYGVQNGYALSASALDRIASAFGIAWDPERSRRSDDRSHPYICEHIAVGSYTGPDGLPRLVSGTNHSDLRDKSPQVEGFRSRDGNLNADVIRRQREHIASSSESKARARALRKEVGLDSEKFDDVKRPWVVVRMQLTGQAGDETTQRALQTMLFQKALEARVVTPTKGPAVGTVVGPDGVVVDDQGEVLHDPRPDPEPPPREERRQERRSSPNQREERRSEPQDQEPRAKFGHKDMKGKLLSELSDKDLQWYVRALEGDLHNPAKSQWYEQNERLLSDAEYEQERRKG